jgi:hypothetical protein
MVDRERDAKYSENKDISKLEAQNKLSLDKSSGNRE